VASDRASTAVADAVLPDGVTVRVRTVSRDDEPDLEALIDGLSLRSRWLRFCSAASDVHEAARLAASAPGVVAVAGDPRAIVGHALFAPDGPGRAEAAFEVADAWQGRGVGTILLGAAAELLADKAVRLAPLTERDVHELLRSLATFPLLAGHRGAPPADVAALEDVLRRVSALADDLPAVADVDCNPVVVAADGAAIVDMRVRVRPPVPRAPIGSLQGP
jgi:GNAT superfamily N-acetyltransferase